MWLLVAVCGGAGADEGIKPYRFSPPPDTLSPRDEDRALIYRQDLDRDIRRLEQGSLGGTPDLRDRRRLIEKRSERDRVDRILRDPPPVETPRDPVTGDRLLEPPSRRTINPILGR